MTVSEKPIVVIRLGAIVTGTMLLTKNSLTGDTSKP